MGNSLTVENHTEKNIEFTYYLAGSKSDLKEEIIQCQVKKKINFFPSLTKSKTVIVGINKKAFRAVRFNQSINIIQSGDGSIRIEIIPNRFQLEINTESIIEKEQQELNWNIPTDEGVINDHNKAINGTIRMMNELSNLLGNVIKGVVGDIPTNKTMSAFVGKFLSDYIINEMKTVEIQQKASGKDRKHLEKIQNKLIGISRAMQIDYPYLKEEMNINTKEAFEFLHKQLMKITNSDLLVSLEGCNHDGEGETSEAAVLVYLFAVRLAIGIFHEIRLLNDGNSNKLERKYLSIFGDNLQEMWTNIIESVSTDCKVNTKGFLVKNSQFRYRNQHIYRLQSVFRARIVERMKDIKEAFIDNRKYQMEFLYEHPLEIVKTWKKMETEEN